MKLLVSESARRFNSHLIAQANALPDKGASDKGSASSSAASGLSVASVPPAAPVEPISPASATGSIGRTKGQVLVPKASQEARKEGVLKLQEIRSKLTGDIEDEILASDRFFVRAVGCTAVDIKKKRKPFTLFLCSDCLLITQPKDKDRFKFIKLILLHCTDIIADLKDASLELQGEFDVPIIRGIQIEPPSEQPSFLAEFTAFRQEASSRKQEIDRALATRSQARASEAKEALENKYSGGRAASPRGDSKPASPHGNSSSGSTPPTAPASGLRKWAQKKNDISASRSSKDS
jgi:hypothetical protein